MKCLYVFWTSLCFFHTSKVSSTHETANFSAARQRCSYEKVFWKYVANLQENTHAEVWFQ